MTIQKVSFTAFTNSQNRVHHGATAQTAAINSDESATAQPHVSSKKVGLGVVLGTLGVLALGFARKLGAVVQKLVKALGRVLEDFKPKSATPRYTSDGVELLEAEDFDTIFLSRHSKLRVKPPIEDVEFVEL